MAKPKQHQETKDASAFREIANGAVTEWRARLAAAEEAAPRRSAVDSEAEREGQPALAKLDASIAALEAEAAAHVAGFNAGLALTRAELAEGDSLACACDAGRLHAELVALEQERRRLQAALEDLARKEVESIGRARSAEEAIRSRRSDAQLPEPPSLPWPSYGGLQAPVPMTAALATVIETGFRAPSPPARLERMRQERRELRIAFERRRREEERAAKNAAAAKAEREADRAREARRVDEKRQEEEREATTDAREADEIEAAWLKRQGAGIRT